MQRQIAVFTEASRFCINDDVFIEIPAQSEYAVIGNIKDSTGRPLVVLHKAYYIPFCVGTDKISIIDCDDDVYHKVLGD